MRCPAIWIQFCCARGCDCLGSSRRGYLACGSRQLAETNLWNFSPMLLRHLPLCCRQAADNCRLAAHSTVAQGRLCAPQIPASQDGTSIRSRASPDLNPLPNFAAPRVPQVRTGLVVAREGMRSPNSPDAHDFRAGMTVCVTCQHPTPSARTDARMSSRRRGPSHVHRR